MTAQRLPGSTQLTVELTWAWALHAIAVMLIPNKTVAEIVLEHPSCASVFHKYRIDFCCGGDVTVDPACAVRGVDAVVRRGSEDRSRHDLRHGLASPPAVS